MPVYNTREDWLNEAIESILAQTHSDFELVIVDDCSNAETQATLSNWASKDSRIRVIRNEQNLGIAAGLNRGLAACQHPLVARMDADDIAHPTRLEKQVLFLMDHPNVDILGSNIVVFGHLNGPKAYPEHDETIKKDLLLASQLSHPAVLYKRDKILAIGGYSTDTLYAEDYDLWAKAALKGLTLYNLQEALLNYRTHAGRKDYERQQHLSAFQIRMYYIREYFGIETTLTPESSTREVLTFFKHLSQKSEGKIPTRLLQRIKRRLLKETIKSRTLQLLFKVLIAVKAL